MTIISNNNPHQRFNYIELPVSRIHPDVWGIISSYLPPNGIYKLVQTHRDLSGRVIFFTHSNQVLLIRSLVDLITFNPDLAPSYQLNLDEISKKMGSIKPSNLSDTKQIILEAKLPLAEAIGSLDEITSNRLKEEARLPYFMEDLFISSDFYRTLVDLHPTELTDLLTRFCDESISSRDFNRAFRLASRIPSEFDKYALYISISNALSETGNNEKSLAILARVPDWFFSTHSFAF